jgi:hypothetical protein
MELRWKNVNELPMDEQSIRKVLLLTNGKRNDSDTLHIVTNYWHVFLDEKDLNIKDLNIDKKETTSDGNYVYGRFESRQVPFNKVKAWMFVDDLINLYYGK